VLTSGSGQGIFFPGSITVNAGIFVTVVLIFPSPSNFTFYCTSGNFIIYYFSAIFPRQ
jgi:hypothetical protein